MAQNDPCMVIIWVQRKTHGFGGLDVKEVPVLERSERDQNSIACN